MFQALGLKSYDLIPLKKKGHKYGGSESIGRSLSEIKDLEIINEIIP